MYRDSVSGEGRSGPRRHPRVVWLPKRAAGPRPPPALAALFATADVRFDGARDWDIRVHEADVYRRILRRGSLGLGEAYMDGLWDANRLDETLRRLADADLGARVRGLPGLRLAGAALADRLLNRQSRARSTVVARRHYDLGNAVFEAMLDPSMSYSCGYWKDASDLAGAQRAKLDLVCRKLGLAPGMRLLDVGCGWGGLAEHAARHYGAEVTGITISREQAVLARARCAGLPVRIVLQDYRDLDGRFDRIASVGMFEHVGPRNYGAFFDAIERVLDPQGLVLLHSIGAWRSAGGGDPWIDRYIFPNGHLPSARQIAAAVEDRYVIEDWHNFGPDYDPTLMAWWRNFDAAWPALRLGGLDRRFYRMWKYYLHASAGYFRARRGQLWQIVLAPRRRAGVYRSVR